MENNYEQSEFKKETGIEDISSIPVAAVDEPNEQFAAAPTIPEPPAETFEEDKDEELESTPFKSKPSILMKDNETSEKKSGVKFDESKNNVVPFLKHEKLKKDKHYKKPVKFENDKFEQPLKR